MNITIQKLTAN